MKTVPERGRRSLVLDTNCFVYLLEGADGSSHRRYVASLFAEAAAGRARIVTSTVCLSEVLVNVARNGTDEDITRVSSAFLNLPGLEVAPVDQRIAVGAAMLRGRTSLRLFDAIVAATGLAAGATELVTNDAALARADHGLAGIYLGDVLA